MTHDDKKPVRGRPKAETPGIRVSTWMREPDYDRLAKMAKQRDDGSISGAIRDFVKLHLK